MNYPKAAALLLVLGLCLVFTQGAYASDFGVSVRTWFPSLNGKVRSGTTLDFKNDLGMENKELTSFNFSFGKPGKLDIDYDSFSFDGKENPAVGYTFDGVVYSPADRVKATNDLTYVAAKWMPTYIANSERNFSWLFGVSHVRSKPA